MRFMSNADCVEEVIFLNVVPGWMSDNKTKIPSGYTVSMGRFVGVGNGVEFEYVGEYKLDGTKKTFEDAKKNFEDIVHHATVNGWFSSDMFKNFDFF